MPHLESMETEMQCLKHHSENMATEMQRLKLHAFVQGQSGVPSQVPGSPAPSLISAPISMAESIKEAQLIAASLRSQGPATMFSSAPSHGHVEPDQGQADPNVEQSHPPALPTQLLSSATQSQIGPNHGQGEIGHYVYSAIPNAGQAHPPAWPSQQFLNQGQEDMRHYGAPTMPNVGQAHPIQIHIGPNQGQGETGHYVHQAIPNQAKQHHIPEQGQTRQRRQ